MARSRRTTASMANANGFILQCNLSKELTRKIAKSSPVIIDSGKSGYNRNIRHIVLNIAELTSKGQENLIFMNSLSSDAFIGSV